MDAVTEAIAAGLPAYVERQKVLGGGPAPCETVPERGVLVKREPAGRVAEGAVVPLEPDGQQNR